MINEDRGGGETAGRAEHARPRAIDAFVRSAAFFTEKPDDNIMGTSWSFTKIKADVRARLMGSGVELTKRELSSATPTIAYRAANEIGEKTTDDEVLDLISLYTTQYLADKAFQRMTGQLERSQPQSREWWERRHRKEDIERSQKDRPDEGDEDGPENSGKPRKASAYAALDGGGERVVYVGIDGDDIGGLVEETLVTDDPEKAREISQAIHAAHKALKSLVKDRGGKVIFDGGDNMLVHVPYDEGLFEAMREAYREHTGHTATVGVGGRPVEAHYALVVGKNTGKDRVVVYDESVRRQLEKIRGEQKELESTTKKLKYRAESSDIAAGEKIKGAMWELNMDVTEASVYDILMRLVERFGLDDISDMESFFASERETLKQRIREVFAKRLDWGLRVADRMATRQERRGMVDAMAALVARARESCGKVAPLAAILASSDPNLTAAVDGLEDARRRLLKASLAMAEAVDAAGTPWSVEMSEVEGKAAKASSSIVTLGQAVDVAMKACDNAQMEHLSEPPSMPVDTRPVIAESIAMARLLSEAATLIEVAAVVAKAKPVVVAAGPNSGKGQKSPHKKPTLTTEEANPEVDYRRTDMQYVDGNQPPSAGQFTMGGEPGDAISIT